jgi:prolyl-tRNA editing enzyme YbaK/EbsC (Cys-tRNA(Pro) deacylase)
LNEPVADPLVLEALRKLGQPFELVPCEADLADTAAFCAAYGIPLERSANTIVVASKRPEGRQVACVVLATSRLDVNGLIRRRLEVKKVSFASGDETARLTGMTIGGVTPFGLPTELPIWIDSRVMEPDWVILGAGSRTAKVKVSPSVLLDLPSAEVVEGLAFDVDAVAGSGPPQEE